MSLPFHCEFAIRSETVYLQALRGIVSAIAAGEGAGYMDERAVIACSAALVEAVDNAIFHAHGRRKTQRILIRIHLNEREIVFEVIDSGDGIGHFPISRPDSMKSSGRGLFLIRNMMTDVESKVIDGEHRLTMRLSL